MKVHGRGGHARLRTPPPRSPTPESRGRADRDSTSRVRPGGGIHPGAIVGGGGSPAALAGWLLLVG